jgi:hypothetical protein
VKQEVGIIHELNKLMWKVCWSQVEQTHSSPWSSLCFSVEGGRLILWISCCWGSELLMRPNSWSKEREGGGRDAVLITSIKKFYCAWRLQFETDLDTQVIDPRLGVTLHRCFTAFHCLVL